MCLLAVRSAGWGYVWGCDLELCVRRGCPADTWDEIGGVRGVVSLIAHSLAGKLAISMSSMVCSKLFSEMLIIFFILKQVSGHFSNQ